MVIVIWSLTEICLILCFLMLCVTCSVADVPVCEPEWFGANCQFRCLCTEYLCDPRGDCVGGSKCKPGYFGPACQYGDIVQLTSLISDLPLWLIDGNDATCNPDPQLNSIAIQFHKGFPFYWLRIGVSKSDAVHRFDVKLNNNVSCFNMRNVSFTNQTLDVFCDVDVPIHGLTLIGTGVSFLCSVYVSLGRNVAFKQSSIQSSIHLHGELMSVLMTDYVHKDRSINFDTRGLSLDVEDSGSYWEYSFKTPHRVSAFLWTTRKSLTSPRFILKTFGANGQLIDMFESMNYHNHIFIVKPQPITSVSAYAKPNESLRLWEFFMFGETLCPDGRYGLDCVSKCRCANRMDICFVSTGSCAAPCAPGFYGFNCSLPCPKTCRTGVCRYRYGGCVDYLHSPHGMKRAANKTITSPKFNCPVGFYGKSCSQPCPDRCAERCERVTGYCLECSDQYYGENCTNECSSHCIKQECNGVTGNCIICDTSRYGPQCQYECGENCMNRECNDSNGACYTCAPGYRGRNCDPVPWNVALFVVLLFLIPSVIACFFCCEVLSDEEAEDVDKDTFSSSLSLEQSITEL